MAIEDLIRANARPFTREQAEETQRAVRIGKRVRGERKRAYPTLTADNFQAASDYQIARAEFWRQHYACLSNGCGQ